MADAIVAGAVGVCNTLHVCIVCGKGFYPKRTDRRKCCSRGCGTAFNGMQAALNKTGGRVFVRTIRKVCTACGKRHSQRGALCSAECRRPAYEARVSGVCRWCGVVFNRLSGEATRYMCSKSCADASASKARRAGRKARKALERGARTASRIDPIAVFERDGWRCKLCGRKTKSSLRGTCDLRAPELDHIQPLSLGGAHDWGNVQCACRGCNMRKGARPMGQLMLFPEVA